MRTFVAFLLLVSLGASAAPKQPALVGVWKSDRELTMDFARAHNKLEPKAEAFWGDMVGRMTLSVSKSRMESRLPDWDVSIEGKPRHMKGFATSTPYRTIYADQAVVVAVANNPVTGVSEVTTYNFVSPDIFWIYTGRGADASQGAHLREYFRRQNTPQ